MTPDQPRPDLYSTDWKQRLIALKRLKESPDSDSLPTLLQMLQENDHLIVNQVLDTLLSMPVDDSVIHPVYDILISNKFDNDFQEIIEFAFDKQDPLTIIAAYDQTQTTLNLLKSRAAQLLFQLNTPECLNLLHQAAHSSLDSTRHAACLVLNIDPPHTCSLSS